MTHGVIHRLEAHAAALRKVCVVCAFALSGAAAHADALTLAARNRAGESIAALTDGNAIRLRAALAKPTVRKIEVVFQLDSAKQVANCTIPARAMHCETQEFAALGWYWSADGQAKRLRTVTATSASGGSASLDVRVAPRPVVLIHGFMTNEKTWAAYTDRFLASVGLAGFAVGDGQADGAMNMGDLASPTQPTATLPQNAAALARYLAGVKKRAKAEMVDVVAHSMGGLVARYYVARLMKERDVAQLLMLGSPHGGSDCSALASALGILAPAALELRPAYLRQIFNRTVTRRQGVPFHLLAGDPIVDGFKAPCSGVPSDMVVAVDSVSAVPGKVSRLPVLHTDMTGSEEVFRKFVAPHLRRQAGEFLQDDDSTVHADSLRTDSTAAAQFTQVFKGHVAAGGTTEVDVNLDQVTVASFALFDPTRSLSLTVRGASGNIINLNAADHGLIRMEDPASLVYLGYGINNPRPGPWRVTLRASAQTAADFALSVRVIGGAVLRARASQVSPTLRESVRLFAALDLPDKSLTDVSMEAVIHQPNGRSERIGLRGNGAEMSAVWKPAQSGLHGVDIVARARAEGRPLERTTLLAIDVQP